MTNKFAFAGVLAGFGYFAYSMIYGDTPKETETNNELKLKNTKSVDEKSNEPVKEKKQDTKEEPVSEEQVTEKQVTEKQVTEEKVKEEPVSEEPILEELQMNELNVEELSDVKKETIYNLEKNTPNNEHIEEQIKKIESEKLNKETHIEKTIVL